jgi:hypothetical protein
MSLSKFIKNIKGNWKMGNITKLADMARELEVENTDLKKHFKEEYDRADKAEARLKAANTAAQEANGICVSWMEKAQKSETRVSALEAEVKMLRTAIDDNKQTMRILEGVIQEIYWMAHRYADGRRSYATSMYNRAIEKAIAAGCKLNVDEGLWAKDAMGPAYDGRNHPGIQDSSLSQKDLVICDKPGHETHEGNCVTCYLET